ncbi:hypothetical protein [Kocuria sp. CPCC 204721]|uniref:hypothetical protein n=1 Tax=Kocuria sp. CPCC 204721 TaxID=3073548 RepID=UPI0034D79EB3
MNWLEPGSEMIQVAYEDLSNFPGTAFGVDTPVRVDVEIQGVLVPMLVVRRADSSRLTVLNNGAVDLRRSQGRPIFQRSSWWQEIRSHQIYVCDPGTVGPNALALNWFQTAPPLWMGSSVAGAVRRISVLLGVRSPEHRTYYGSSAGGFAALFQLCGDPRARAVVNNAQFDWTRWYPQFVTEVLGQHFGGRLAADVRRSWPQRTNALNYLLRRAQGLRIEYHVNMASPYDRDIQYPLFLEFMRENPDRCGDIMLHHYFDPEMNHNPLPKPRTLAILNSRPEPGSLSAR